MQGENNSVMVFMGVVAMYTLLLEDKNSTKKLFIFFFKICLLIRERDGGREEAEKETENLKHTPP